jgi:hypothetical protein
MQTADARAARLQRLDRVRCGGLYARVRRQAERTGTGCGRGMFDLQLPFFEALWRRIATVVVALGWAAFELANGAAGWAILFAAMGGWAIYQFFVVWDA